MLFHHTAARRGTFIGGFVGIDALLWGTPRTSDGFEATRRRQNNLLGLSLLSREAEVVVMIAIGGFDGKRQ